MSDVRFHFDYVKDTVRITWPDPRPETIEISSDLLDDIVATRNQYARELRSTKAILDIRRAIPR